MPPAPTARRRARRRRRSTRSPPRSAATATTRTATATPTRRASTRTATTTSAATTATTTIPSATTRRRSIRSPIRRTAAATAWASSARPTSTPTSPRRMPRSCARRKRCGDGIDESCRGRRQRPEQRHHLHRRRRLRRLSGDGQRPGRRLRRPRSGRAPRRRRDRAARPRISNCNGTIGEGCVPCDLDGDGFERIDRGQQLPRRQRQAPGHGRLQRRRRRRVPRRDAAAGGSEGGVSVGKVAAALRGFCRGIYEPTALTGTAKINPFGGARRRRRLQRQGVRRLPGAHRSRAATLDGDGWPGVAMSNGKNCNPDNVTLDCDDNDPTIFPSAPVNCKIDDGTYKNNCTPQGPADCTGDADGDGYARAAPTATTTIRRSIRSRSRSATARTTTATGSSTKATPIRRASRSWPRARSPRAPTPTPASAPRRIGTCVCSIAQPVEDPSMRAGAAAHDVPGRRRGGRKRPAASAPASPSRRAATRRRRRTTTATGASMRPTARNLAVKGMTCGINVGQCKAGVVIGCDMAKTNCFEQFGRTPATTAWYVCSSAAPDPVTVCPTAEAVQRARRRLRRHARRLGAAARPGTPTTDERDHDGDHYLACTGCGATLAAGILGCGDCNDTVPTVHPGAAEILQRRRRRLRRRRLRRRQGRLRQGRQRGQADLLRRQRLPRHDERLQFCGSCSRTPARRRRRIDVLHVELLVRDDGRRLRRAG